MQSSAANFAFTSGLIPVAGVAAGSTAPVDAAIANTWRKRSSAVCPTNSTTRRPVSPGTETVSYTHLTLPTNREV